MRVGRQAAARVLAEMVSSGADSRKALATALQLSKASVSRTVSGLLAHGLLKEGRKRADAGRGRRTISLRMAGDLAYLLGTDLEGRALRACLLDCSHRLVATGKCTINVHWSISEILRQWGNLLESVVKRSRIPLRKIAGIGVGLPGMVSRDGLHSRAYLPPGQWIDLDPWPALERLSLKVVGANNVLCTSDYERRLGAGRGQKSFLSVLVRFGIGAAMFGNGSFLMGEEMFSTELGHMCLDMRGPVCICGGRGCLDVFASGRTLPPLRRRKGLAWRQDLAKRSQALAIGIANVLKLFHPPLVIINGVYNDDEAEIRPLLTRAIDAELRNIGLSVPKVAFGREVEFKTSMGAALRAADAFLQEHFMKNMLGKKTATRKKAAAQAGKPGGL